MKKDEHTGNDFPGYAAEQPRMGANWLDIERKERGAYPIVDAHFMPTMCNHRDDAPCMKVAKNGAITKRADGIVIIDPIKAKGQKEIVDACPPVIATVFGPTAKPPPIFLSPYADFLKATLRFNGLE